MIFSNFSPNVYNVSNIITFIMYFTSIFFSNKNDSTTIDSTIPSNIVSISILWSFIIIALVVYIELNKDELLKNDYVNSFPIFSIDNTKHSLVPTLDRIHTYLYFILAISCIGLTSSISLIRNISRKIFCFISSISWIGIFHLFITSTPGFSFSLFMQPSMLLSLLSSQSIVFRSFFDESNNVLNPIHLSSGIMFIIGINHYYDNILIIYNKLFGYNSNSCTNNNQGVIPFRLDEMSETINIDFYYLFIFFLIVSHVLFNLVIYYLEFEESKLPSEINESKYDIKKTNNKNLNNTDINDIPDDCIEISTDEAISLVNGKNYSNY